MVFRELPSLSPTHVDVHDTGGAVDTVHAEALVWLLDAALVAAGGIAVGKSHVATLVLHLVEEATIGLGVDEMILDTD